ncbi:alpha/beta hydrolase [Staphylococcus coagulans]|uniref:alpha/beta fold hydrolase n=1 Tax=Staphylococcus coagulans TaxID=74706 RepID=UPI001BE5C92A|nr:alpha/beta hydrolase [Staphylococcus coagulans]MBT2814184.1 alpha/beta hydrolase [Staphylococcus coagulans]MBT2816504.1 alpha/beta hydrolase [Staphylococcus coagulans]MBT2836164.1 alpha/beta hydrolase [Staphylococcus coagulans]MBT2840692.1 alpha/beta hydrolase [Staphylococcus coagulans]MBT2848409.1 alpha/beta hydrolase [Staphylococcus coagulans]
MWKWETDSKAKGVIVIVHNMLEHTGRYAYVITHLKRNGYHVIMGDLPGQGQTSRMNKGQIESFEIYQERVLEWIEIAEAYHLPTFIIGVGLGGLICVNLLEKVQLDIEGLILISPLMAFHNSNKTRKNFLIANIGDVSKSAKFDLGFQVTDLTRNPEVQEETLNDAMMLKKVSYHWYKEVIRTMKETAGHMDQFMRIPMCVMYGTEDVISDTKVTYQFVNNLSYDELYFKAWEGLAHEIHNEPEREAVMRYILSFLNNKVFAAGYLIDDENSIK